MCRHLSTVGNVTHRESDTPRGRALILDKVRMNNGALTNADFINAIYDAELSGSCRRNCVSSYDEVGLLLAARQDIVEMGVAPDHIKALAEELQDVRFQTSGEGDVLYYVDPYTERQPEIIDAFLSIAGPCKLVKGGDTGKALRALGFKKEADIVAKKFIDAVRESGCQTVVTSCPASYDALAGDCLLAEVPILHTSEFLMQKELKGNSAKKCYFLGSDYFTNYKKFECPERLMDLLGYELLPFGTNTEESYAVGEGAVIYDRINPGILEKLCARVCSQRNSESDVLVTCSPFTRYALKEYDPSLKVISIEQAVAQAAGNVYVTCNS